MDDADGEAAVVGLPGVIAGLGATEASDGATMGSGSTVTCVMGSGSGAAGAGATGAGTTGAG